MNRKQFTLRVFCALALSLCPLKFFSCWNQSSVYNEFQMNVVFHFSIRTLFSITMRSILPKDIQKNICHYLIFWWFDTSSINSLSSSRTPFYYTLYRQLCKTRCYYSLYWNEISSDWTHFHACYWSQESQDELLYSFVQFYHWWQMENLKFSISKTIFSMKIHLVLKFYLFGWISRSMFLVVYRIIKTDWRIMRNIEKMIIFLIFWQSVSTIW